jgi:hypothetical protein
MSTTNFKDWLRMLGRRNLQEVYCLYRSVCDCITAGPFKTKQVSDRNRWKVTCEGVDTPLLLASEDARDTFLYHLNRNYSGGTGSVENYYRATI